AQDLQGKALADSLMNELPKTKEDTNQVKLIIKAAKAIISTDPAAAMKYADSAMHLSQQHQWQKGIGIAYINKARIYTAISNFTAGNENAGKAYEIFKSIQWKPAMGDALVTIASNYEALSNYSKAIENNYMALSIYEEAGSDAGIAWTYNNIGADYYWLHNYPKALENYNIALRLQKKLNDKNGIASALDNIASVYKDEGELNKVNEYNLQAIKLFEEIGDQAALGRIYINRGNFLQEQKNFDSAIIFYKKAIRIAQKLDIARTLAFGNGGIGALYLKVAKNGYEQYLIPDSLKISKSMLLEKAYNYFSRALEISEKAGEPSLIMQFAESLSETEDLRGNYKAALKYYKLSAENKDSIFNDENERKIAALENERITEVKDKEIQLLNKEKKLQASEQEKKDAEAKRIKNTQYFIITALGIVVLAVVIIAMIQFRHNKQKQHANIALQHQKEKVESTLTELKSTQAQLIQSEKMASLGELTAGIAHEIQNPLNFVNNFSEVNKELLVEMKDEMNKGNLEDANAIANDVIDNFEKINHHGKRADAIVKGMLQHSRTSTGKKEPTDINALCDEYLRLSYHGLKAKDKGVNATMKTDFDNSIEKVNIIPQDIGRVLLNLYNNAFYAVNEKKKTADESYQPTVSIQTKKINARPPARLSHSGGDATVGRDKVEIVVKDNGNGIPQNIVDKIFQPFFTTKPTGEGTGLGLSLSYDIIKAHGGEIKVNAKEGEGSEFIIHLPL
ncbi:MAG: tetratricopeptide repeat protein, partial [Parafilimonas sp.]